jgi:hypothetical protein
MPGRVGVREWQGYGVLLTTNETAHLCRFVRDVNLNYRFNY